jgi:hypothetical protein
MGSIEKRMATTIFAPAHFKLFSLIPSEKKYSQIHIIIYYFLKYSDKVPVLLNMLL